jgi:hypothetical protein
MTSPLMHAKQPAKEMVVRRVHFIPDLATAQGELHTTNFRKTCQSNCGKWVYGRF